MKFFHKFYVFFIAAKNMIACLYKVTDRIAAIRIEIVTDGEIESLEGIMEDRVQNLKMDRTKPQEQDDDDIEPHDGFIH